MEETNKHSKNNSSETPNLASTGNTCPCCSGRLIQQVRQQTVRWYCLSCRHEMPNFSPLLSSEQASDSVSTRTAKAAAKTAKAATKTAKLAASKVRSLRTNPEKKAAKKKAKTASLESSKAIFRSKESKKGTDPLPPSSSVA